MIGHTFFPSFFVHETKAKQSKAKQSKAKQWDGALPGRTSEQDTGEAVHSHSRGSTSSRAAAAQALAVSSGHGCAGRGGAVVLHGLVRGRQNDRGISIARKGAVLRGGQSLSSRCLAGLVERELEFGLAVDGLLRGKVTDRGLIGAGSRAGLGLGSNDPAKMRQGSSRGGGSRRSH